MVATERPDSVSPGRAARDEEWPAWEGGPYNYRSGFRRRGAAGEFVERGVPHILKVGDADFAGVEAVGGEIAQEGEEGHSLAERGILLGVLAEGDQVHDFFFLLGCALHEDVALPACPTAIQPQNPPPALQLLYR